MILKKHKSVIVIFIIVLIILSIGIIIYSIWSNPLNAFQRKFNFKLPDTVEIINKSYSFYYDCLELKVGFDIDDYPKIEKGIEDYAVKNGMYKPDAEKDKGLYYNFGIFCKLWDKENEEVIIAYIDTEKGVWTKTREIYVLITQNTDGQYFLHVYY